MQPLLPPPSSEFPAGAFIADLKKGQHYKIVVQSRKGNDAVLSVHHDFGKVNWSSKKLRVFMEGVSKKLNLPICNPKSTPLAIECRKARKEEEKQAARERQEKQQIKIESDLSEWFARIGSTEKVAIAELVRYCNRFVKCFPAYKNQSTWQKNIVSLIYQLKDYWITQNAGNCIQHCKSSSFTYTYVDWEALHFERWDTGEYQDEEDFEITRTTNFYAYTFLIDGVEFRFHSQTVLFEEDRFMEPNPEADGSAKPLSESEKVIPVINSCAMLAFSLGREVYNRHKHQLAILINQRQKKERQKERRKNNRKTS